MAATKPRHGGRQPKGKRFTPARCGDCHAPILWLQLRGSWRKFDPAQVAGKGHTGVQAYPIEGKTAWPLPRLVEELMGRRELGHAEALEEAYDFPWHPVHVCRKDPA